MKAFKKNILAAGLAAATVMMAPWQGANAATGQTDVTINFPNIVILHYPNQLILTFTGTDLNDGQGTVTPTGQALAATATFDADITDGTTTGLSTVAVTVQNAYAVRGISSSGNINISGSFDGGGDTASNGSSTAVGSNFAVSAASIPAPGLATATPGDISFDLDISGVTDNGAHTGMSYTITATAP